MKKERKKANLTVKHTYTVVEGIVNIALIYVTWNIQEKYTQQIKIV